MKLKEFIEYVLRDEYIVITYNMWSYCICVNTIRDKLPCTAYDNYLRLSNCKVVSIKANDTGFIEITVEDDE